MGQLTDLERYLFDTSGVLIRRGAIDRKTVEVAVDQIAAKTKLTEWKFPTLDLGNIFWVWMTSEAIFPPVLEMCGPHARLDHAFGLRGGSLSNSPVQLHGGPDSSQYSCFYHDVRKPVGLVGQLSVGVVLKGQAPATGGFCYLPGSHKALRRVDGRHVFEELFKHDAHHEAIVVPKLSPGDVIFFSESLIHGDTGPRMNSERLMAYYKFCPGWMCWRDPAQQEKYRHLAPNQRAVNLLEPPWTGRFDDDNHQMSVKNTRRPPTE